MIEDYRAGPGVDRRDEQDDRVAGHHLAEENPTALAAALVEFLA